MKSVVINYIRFSYIQHQNRIPIGWLSILPSTAVTTATSTTIPTDRRLFWAFACQYSRIGSMDSLCCCHRAYHNAINNSLVAFTATKKGTHSHIHTHIHCFSIWAFCIVATQCITWHKIASISTGFGALAFREFPFVFCFTFNLIVVEWESSVDRCSCNVSVYESVCECIIWFRSSTMGPKQNILIKCANDGAEGSYG